MWAQFLVIKEPYLVAVVKDDQDPDATLSPETLLAAQEELGAEDFLMDSEVVTDFINTVNYGEQVLGSEFNLGKRCDAKAEIELQNDNLLAVLQLTGAHGGKPISAAAIMSALTKAKVTKGINKLALKKALALGLKLKKSETLSQPVAQGKSAIDGRDSKFVPLIKDFRERVLAPTIESGSKTGKMDMRNLGGQITVAPGDVVMKRLPATPGLPGFKVTGEVLAPIPGKDLPYGTHQGTKVSKKNPDYLIAAKDGLPKVRDDGVEIDNALILKSVSIGTGHISFKGDVVVEGDIEPGMVVKATGDVQVSGFVESSVVQAHGNVTVAKGIIGQWNTDGEESNCQIVAKGGITAGYALNAQLKSSSDIQLALHAVNCDLKTKQDLVVLNEGRSHGLISGGRASVGGKLLCSQLGSEGDAATEIRMIESFQHFLDEFKQAKEAYKKAQDHTMEVVRKELAFKKIPKSKRTRADEDELELFKKQSQQRLTQAKKQRDRLEQHINETLEGCTVEALHHVYTNVSVHYGTESITTRNDHEYSLFSFDKYQIDRQSIKPEE